MNKATGAILCALLVFSPLLIILFPQPEQSSQSSWQLQYRGLLDYAKRQPSRILYLTGLKAPALSIDKVIEDTSATVSAIPDATIHSAGAALVQLKYLLVDGLRMFLQGAEYAYLRSADLVSSLAANGWAPYKRSDWSIKRMSYSARDWGRRGRELVRDGWEWIGPGGRLHPEEFLERFYGHIIIEGLLAIIIGYLFFQSSFKSSGKTPKPLTEEEIDELCIEWEPEPLHTTLAQPRKDRKDVIITSSTGKLVEVQGVPGQVLNMVSFDFLGCAGNQHILDDCKATVAKYGVGACGPRGFYGTIDVHLNLENALAKFMETAEAIIYSYDLSTIPSVIPAFANAKDLILVDEAADYSVQNGCALSRAKVVRFKHNDMEDLERVLKSEISAHAKKRKPLNRRFIIVEGIYKVTGDIAPLRKIYELKEKYKFRLVVDESWSFGVLGQSGRGACEHFGLKPSDVEIVCASMGNALASVGGFCVGDREIIDHQRLSGLGYCFSAALPPYLATAAIGSLAILDSDKGRTLLKKLQLNAKQIRSGLRDVKELELIGPPDSVSPVVHAQLKHRDEQDPQNDAHVLQDVADRALKSSRVLFTVHKTSGLDRNNLPSTIRLAVTADHDDKDIKAAISALKSAANAVIKRSSL